MFLLIRGKTFTANSGETVFTFHNVSINTSNRFFGNALVNVFTFHNVSINTDLGDLGNKLLEALHSTMFLLILIHMQLLFRGSYAFTFHNVSINT